LIWIIGGTTETGILIEKIKGNYKYIVSVATYSGKEILRDDNVVVARMNYGEMLKFIKEYNIETVIDLSHPYAVEVSQNAKGASDYMGINYLRYIRKGTEASGAVYVNSIEECACYLKDIIGCVFFTTGMKNIRDFEKVRNNNRFIYRVLPTSFSIEECINNNIKMQDIIAVLGPFSEEFNAAMFMEYRADFVVMKDSGVEGGTPEKINACLNCGSIPIIIGRGIEAGVYDMDKLVEMIK